MSVPKVEGRACFFYVYFLLFFDWWSIVKLRGLLGHSLGFLGLSLASLEAPWGALEASWTSLGPVLGHLGALLDPLGALLGRSGGLLGRSWDLLEGSKIDQKIDPKIDPKSSRIREGQNRSGATPAEVSEGSERGTRASCHLSPPRRPTHFFYRLFFLLTSFFLIFHV